MSPQDIARLSGCSRRTVNRYLHHLFPDHDEGTWWRFEEAEAIRIATELKAARRTWDTQPLRAVRDNFSRCSSNNTQDSTSPAIIRKL